MSPSQDRRDKVQGKPPEDKKTVPKPEGKGMSRKKKFKTESKHITNTASPASDPKVAEETNSSPSKDTKKLRRLSQFIKSSEPPSPKEEKPVMSSLFPLQKHLKPGTDLEHTYR